MEDETERDRRTDEVDRAIGRADYAWAPSGLVGESKAASLVSALAGIFALILAALLDAVRRRLACGIARLDMRSATADAADDHFAEIDVWDWHWGRSHGHRSPVGLTVPHRQADGGATPGFADLH